jgi:hypothetical protein
MIGSGWPKRPILDALKLVLLCAAISFNSLGKLTSVDERAGEAVEDDTGVSVSMSESALLEQLRVKQLKNDILSNKHKETQQWKL